MPGYLAAMALLQSDATCGLPPSALDPTTPYALPKSLDAARTITAAQTERLCAVITAAGASDAPLGKVASGASGAGKVSEGNVSERNISEGKVSGVNAGASVGNNGDVKDGVCTDDNKHIVLGAYDVIGPALQLLVRQSVRDSPLLASAFLTLLVMQRYTPLSYPDKYCSLP